MERIKKIKKYGITSRQPKGVQQPKDAFTGQNIHFCCKYEAFLVIEAVQQERTWSTVLPERSGSAARREGELWSRHQTCAPQQHIIGTDTTDLPLSTSLLSQISLARSKGTLQGSRTTQVESPGHAGHWCVPLTLRGPPQGPQKPLCAWDRL